MEEKLSIEELIRENAAKDLRIAELESLLGEPSSDPMPYDTAWRTEANDASHLLIPMVNEVFGERYTGNAEVSFSPNEHFLNQQDGKADHGFKFQH